MQLEIEEFRWAQEQNQIEVDWSDGHKTVLPGHVLRNGCPCAHCGLKRREQEAPETASASAAQVDFVDPVGLYAVSIGFKDMHVSGIYTYELLRELCYCPVCLPV